MCSQSIWLVNAGLNYQGAVSQDKAFWNGSLVIQGDLELHVRHFLVHNKGIATEKLNFEIGDLRSFFDLVLYNDGPSNA